MKWPGCFSLNVGVPREIPWRGGTVRTAIWKLPVAGRRTACASPTSTAMAKLIPPAMVGEQRAVFVDRMESYHYWQQFPPQ